MNTDDVAYLGLLFFSIGFGFYYRQIRDKNLKKNVGTAIGLLIVFIVSGVHILHSFVTFLVNAAIILLFDKRKCHIVSFIFSFAYLLFFRTTIYFGLPYPPPHTNLIQMMLTFKLVGLAFEINATHTDKNKKESQTNEGGDGVENGVHANFTDIFHYTFNYIGVLTGPYYRYRTFDDYFELPYANCANYKDVTLNKLKYVPLFALLFLWGTYNWPLSYALTDEFYERSWLYRYWFIWPNFFIFRMRIYTGLVLSECVCTMAGLGAYPAFSSPKAGEGPSENLHKLRNCADASRVECNFETIHNINAYGADFVTTYREGMKQWNICIQYWLANYVYKRFPSKKYRTIVTMLVSSYWHGVYLGYYVCIGTVPFALLLEDVYYKLFLKDEANKTKSWFPVYEWIHWFFKMHFFSYQAIAFLLLDVGTIVHYYNSIYHAGLVVGVVLYGVGIQLLKNRRKNA